jgi:signal transduction histidine kinase
MYMQESTFPSKHKISKGKLQRLLQREISLLCVISLGIVVIWLSMLHYEDRFQKTLTWLNDNRSALEHHQEIEKKRLIERLSLLTKIYDSQLNEIKSVLKKDETFITFQVIQDQTKVSIQKGSLSQSLYRKLEKKVKFYHHSNKSHMPLTTMQEVSSAEAYYISDENTIYLIAFMQYNNHYFAILNPLNNAWLQSTTRMVHAESVLSSPDQILLSSFKNIEGIKLIPRWEHSKDYSKVSSSTEKLTEYHLMYLSSPYRGYNGFHREDTQFYAFHTSLRLYDDQSKTVAWVWMILPKNVMLTWPKMRIMIVLIIGLFTLLIMVWRVRVKTYAYLAPLNELIMEIENLNLAIGGLSTLQRTKQLNDFAHLQQAVSQLKYQLTLNQNLEEQLRQSQKMEVIGTLAGGVAHDFNNLLSVILLNSEFLESDLADVISTMPIHDEKESEQYSEWLDMIKEMVLACEQAKVLTQQLLSLSRDQSNQHVAFDICQSIEKSHKLLQRLVPENINIHFHKDVEELWINGNENALQQVIMNLTLNAKDAIQDQGKISLKVYTHTQNQIEVATGGALKPGDYACIQVKDNGHGISKDHINKVFEPFFSLKGKKGTGLGLTVVFHTIVRRFKGSINIQSQLKEGSTFYLYIPAIKSRRSVSNTSLTTLNTPVQDQHIVLLEDHDLVRRSMTQVLINLGFKVSSFASGIEFIQWLEERTPQEIHEIALVVTDVVMPNMSGPKIWTEVCKLHPYLPFIFLTGYDNDMLNQYQIPQDLVLLKPISVDVLYKKIVKMIQNRQSLSP